MSNTTFLQEPEPEDREQFLELYVKDRLQSLDRVTAGYTDVSLQGLTGNVSLSPTQAKHRRIKLTGAPSGAVTLKIPHATGANADIIFVNACTGATSTVTVKSTGANAGNSAGVPLATGETRHVSHDGESVYGVSLQAIAYTAEASIVSAGTLDSAAYGKMHVVTGTTADYTVTLPTPAAADVGKVIGFRMSNALTKLVTLDAGATRSIDGQQTRVMWKDEVAVLQCIATTGVCWVKVNGKQSRPMVGVMHLNANQSIANATGPVKVTLNTSDTNDGGMTDTTNNRFNIKRPGNYELNAQAWFNSVAVTTGLLDFYKGGAQLFETYDMSPSSSHNLVPKASVVVTLAAGDQLDLRVYQNSGSAQNCIGHATTLYTFMSVVEIPSW